MLDQRSDPRVVPGHRGADAGVAVPAHAARRTPDSTTGWARSPATSRAAGCCGVEGRRRGPVLPALFSRTGHDFVVPTESMSGGVPRSAGRSASFRSPEVSHGSYFANAESRAALARVAGRPSPAQAGRRVRRTGAASDARAVPRRARRRTGDVLLIPDLSGASRFDDRRPGGLAGDQPAAPAAVPRPHWARRGSWASPTVSSRATRPLLAELGTRFNAHLHPYDPRRSLRNRGDTLRKAVRKRLGTGAPVHLVATGRAPWWCWRRWPSRSLLASWRAAGSAGRPARPAAARNVDRDRAPGRGPRALRPAGPARRRQPPTDVGNRLRAWPSLAAISPDPTQRPPVAGVVGARLLDGVQRHLRHTPNAPSARPADGRFHVTARRRRERAAPGPQRPADLLRRSSERGPAGRPGCRRRRPRPARRAEHDAVAPLRPGRYRGADAEPLPEMPRRAPAAHRAGPRPSRLGRRRGRGRIAPCCG